LRVKKAASAVIKALVFLVFAAGLFIFITVIANRGQGVPNFFGYCFLNVRTQSMEPVFPVGTVVITKKAVAGTLKKGDIISFYSQDPAIKGIPNTHRIYSVEKKENGGVYFITKGDNNDVQDQYPVYPSEIIGVVVGSVGSVGKAVSLLSNRYVLFFVIILPLAVLIAVEARNTGKMIRGKNDEAEKENHPKDDSEVNQ